MKTKLMEVTVLLAIILVVAPCAVQAKIIAVSASTQVLALDDNGTVWAWGDNSYGQLGIGTMGGNYGTPQKVLIDNVTQISAGGDSFALKSDGTVWAWGYGEDGRLGYGGVESQSMPVQVKNLTDVIVIAAGVENCFALKSDGTVWAWGDNRGGEVGDGTTNGDGTTGVSQHFRFTPMQIKGLTNIKTLSDGGGYAINNEDIIYAWGHETTVYSNGTIIYRAVGGLPGSDLRLTPSLLQKVDNIAQITNGGDYTLYVKSDGTVWGWGDTYYGELGDGTISSGNSLVFMTPSVQAKITGVKKLSSINGHIIASTNDGTVWVWGKYIDVKGTRDNSGQSPPINKGGPTPTLINGLDHVVDVSAGFDFNIALKDDGSVWGWGRNDNKALGNGKNNVEVSPILLFSGSPKATAAPTATSIATPTSDSTLMNSLQATSAPTQNQSTPVPTSGFSFNTMAIIGCSLVVAGLLLEFRWKKEK